MKKHILKKDSVLKIKQLFFFKELEGIFGPIELSDEENIGYEIMVWRLVRPFIKDDVGPLHSDRWFWDIDKSNRNYEIPKNKRKIRCWISLYSNQFEGWRGVPNSQGKKFEYDIEYRDDRKKPIFNESKYKLSPIAIDSTPGNIIIFNDGMLHGGCLNKSDYMRISLEFTMFVDCLTLNKPNN